MSPLFVKTFWKNFLKNIFPEMLDFFLFIAYNKDTKEREVIST